MAFAPVEVEGLAESNRALTQAGRELRAELRVEMIAAGEPVRMRAEQFAQSSIRNIGEQWSRMRVGFTGSLVYVAPKRHRGRFSRPNLAPLLIDRVLVPAAEAERGRVEAGVERAVENSLRRVGL